MTGVQGYTGIKGIQNFTEFDTTQYPGFLPAELGWSQRDEALFLGVTGMNWIQLGVGFKSVQGITGLALSGSTGLQGPQGITGPGAGAQGGTGVMGPTGILGLQGNTGLGIQGRTGVSGVTGILGINGSTGIVGVTGLRGLTGLQGVQGNTGVHGKTGIQGYTGLQGVGQTGIAGNTGIPGNNLKTYTWSIQNPIVADYPGPRLISSLALTRVSAFVVGNGATNAVFNLYDRTDVTHTLTGFTGTKLFGSDMTVVTSPSSISTVLDTTSFASTSLPADSWLWLKINSVLNDLNMYNFVLTMDTTVV